MTVKFEMFSVLTLQRCFDRLKKSRDKFMERFRGPAVAAEAEKPTTAIQDLMNEEWNQFQRENPGLGADQVRSDISLEY